MTYSIVDYFRKFSGYKNDAVDGVINDVLTTSVIPAAHKMFEEMTLYTVSIDTGSQMTTHSVADIVISQLGSFLADLMYDTQKVDPETGLPENMHWDIAMRLMLQIWGVYKPGMGLVLPGNLNSSIPSFFCGRIDSQLKSADWAGGSVRTHADIEKWTEAIQNQTSSNP